MRLLILSPLSIIISDFQKTMRHLTMIHVANLQTNHETNLHSMTHN